LKLDAANLKDGGTGLTLRNYGILVGEYSGTGLKLNQSIIHIQNDSKPPQDFCTFVEDLGRDGLSHP
jgi:hypothetical protein